jgi:hypothetical protein
MGLPQLMLKYLKKLQERNEEDNKETEMSGGTATSLNDSTTIAV